MSVAGVFAALGAHWNGGALRNPTPVRREMIPAVTAGCALSGGRRAECTRHAPPTRTAPPDLPHQAVCRACLPSGGPRRRRGHSAGLLLKRLAGSVVIYRALWAEPGERRATFSSRRRGGARPASRPLIPAE